MNTSTLELNKTKNIIVKNWLIYVILIALDFVLGIFTITYFIHNLPATDNSLSYILYVALPVGVFFALALGLATSSEDESVTVKIPEHIYESARKSFFLFIFGVIVLFLLSMFILFLLMLGSMAGD